MMAWIAGAIYLVGLALAVEAVMTVRTSQGAIAWSVSLVAVPFLAVPAYLVFGRSKFRGMVEAYEQQKDEIDDLVREIRSNIEPWTVNRDVQSGVYAAVRRLSGMNLTRGNRADLLIDGEATFESIFAGIEAAREYVLVQFYMFHDDGLGGRMQRSLIDRARAGVRVCLLYDEVGSHGLPQSWLDALVDAGVAVSSFRPNQGRWNRFQLNFRNHRKVVVVDGMTAWIGGHNVGDEYLGLDPAFSPWRDTHVRLQGPVVTQLQLVFAGDWYWATRSIPDLNWRPRAAADSDQRAMIVPSAPTQRLETAALLFVTALNSAEHRIWLSAPYFVPDDAVLKALELAALRGVDVRVITTGRPDSWPVFLAGFHYICQLRDLDIRFYSFEPGFLHEKVMLIDDEVSAVGTANFDNRSFRLNFEVTALIVDSDFARQVEAMLLADFARSRPIDPAELDGRPFWWQLGVDLARIASPVL